MTKAYVVTAPLATPYLQDGTRAYLYQGADVPGGLRSGEIERFLDLGYFAEKEARQDEPSEEGESGEEPPRSGKGSGADAWAAYAQSLGIEVPEGASRDDVITLVDANK